jgi:flagellar assembly protein FliH
MGARARPAGADREGSVSSPLAEVTEVLRGMHVEPVPVRLARTRAGGIEPAATRPATKTSGEEEALRQRLEEATRQGHEEGARAGYEAGWRKGLADAAAESDAALASATAQANRALQEQQKQLFHLTAVLQRATEEALAAAEDEMVALCFETVCRLVGPAAVQIDGVRAQLGALAAHARAGRCISLHVHPDDAVLLQASASEAGVDWVPDPEIALGGCILRSTDGGLDARLETMLAACKAALLAARARSARGDAQAGGAAR